MLGGGVVKKLIKISAIGLLIIVTLPSPTAHANYLGGKFSQSPGTTIHPRYTYPSPTRYGGNVWQGAANWRNAATRVKPTDGLGPWFQITVNDVYVADTYYGQAWLNPGPAGPIYTSAGFYLNHRLMDHLNDFDRTFVATHEFGHTLGLAHTTPANTDSIMRPGSATPTFPWYNTPMPYDKGQINALYN